MPNMTANTGQQEIMKRYLLNELSEEERASFEERFDSDRDLFEEVVALENDMIDAYASGMLTSTEAKRFEDRYLTTPQRQSRVNFAKSLLGYVSEAESTAPAKARPESTPKALFSLQNFFQLHTRVAAYSFMAVAAIAVWLLVIDVRYRHELQETQTEQARLRQDAQELAARIKALTGELQEASAHTDHNQQVIPPQQPSQNVEVAELVISPGLARSGYAQNLLTIFPHAISAQLLLKLDQREYASYNATLETPEGTTVFDGKGLKSQISRGHGKVALVSLPLNKLQDNEYYILRLSGVATDGPQSVDEYSFRVQRAASK